MKHLIFLTLIFVSNYSLATENANLNNGKILYLEKKYDDAKIELEKSIVRNPKSTESYLYLSRVFKKLKNLNEEKKNLNTVLLLEPKNEEALYLMINLNINEGDFKEASAKYQLFKNNCNKCENLQKLEKLIKTQQANDK